MSTWDGLIWQQSGLYIAVIFEMTSVQTTASFFRPNTTISSTVSTVHINGTYTKTQVSYGQLWPASYGYKFILVYMITKVYQILYYKVLHLTNLLGIALVKNIVGIIMYVFVKCGQFLRKGSFYKRKQRSLTKD